jgi:hypothetical protein
LIWNTKKAGLLQELKKTWIDPRRQTTGLPLGRLKGKLFITNSSRLLDDLLAASPCCSMTALLLNARVLLLSSLAMAETDMATPTRTFKNVS